MIKARIDFQSNLYSSHNPTTINIRKKCIQIKNLHRKTKIKCKKYKRRKLSNSKCHQKFRRIRKQKSKEHKERVTEIRCMTRLSRIIIGPPSPLKKRVIKLVEIEDKLKNAMKKIEKKNLISKKKKILRFLKKKQLIIPKQYVRLREQMKKAKRSPSHVKDELKKRHNILARRIKRRMKKKKRKIRRMKLKIMKKIREANEQMQNLILLEKLRYANRKLELQRREEEECKDKKKKKKKPIIISNVPEKRKSSSVKMGGVARFGKGSVFKRFSRRSTVASRLLSHFSTHGRRSTRKRSSSRSRRSRRLTSDSAPTTTTTPTLLPSSQTTGSSSRLESSSLDSARKPRAESKRQRHKERRSSGRRTSDHRSTERRALSKTRTPRILTEKDAYPPSFDLPTSAEAKLSSKFRKKEKTTTPKYRKSEEIARRNKIKSKLRKINELKYFKGDEIKVEQKNQRRQEFERKRELAALQHIKDLKKKGGKLKLQFEKRGKKVIDKFDKPIDRRHSLKGRQKRQKIQEYQTPPPPTIPEKRELSVMEKILKGIPLIDITKKLERPKTEIIYDLQSSTTESDPKTDDQKGEKSGEEYQPYMAKVAKVDRLSDVPDDSLSTQSDQSVIARKTRLGEAAKLNVIDDIDKATENEKNADDLTPTSTTKSETTSDNAEPIVTQLNAFRTQIGDASDKKPIKSSDSSSSAKKGKIKSEETGLARTITSFTKTPSPKKSQSKAEYTVKAGRLTIGTGKSIDSLRAGRLTLRAAAEAAEAAKLGKTGSPSTKLYADGQGDSELPLFAVNVIGQPKAAAEAASRNTVGDVKKFIVAKIEAETKAKKAGQDAITIKRLSRQPEIVKVKIEKKVPKKKIDPELDILAAQALEMKNEYRKRTTIEAWKSVAGHGHVSDETNTTFDELSSLAEVEEDLTAEEFAQLKKQQQQIRENQRKNKFIPSYLPLEEQIRLDKEQRALERELTKTNALIGDDEDIYKQNSPSPTPQPTNMSFSGIRKSIQRSTLSDSTRELIPQYKPSITGADLLKPREKAEKKIQTVDIKYQTVGRKMKSTGDSSIFKRTTRPSIQKPFMFGSGGGVAKIIHTYKPSFGLHVTTKAVKSSLRQNDVMTQVNSREILREVAKINKITVAQLLKEGTEKDRKLKQMREKGAMRASKEKMSINEMKMEIDSFFKTQWDSKIGPSLQQLEEIKDSMKRKSAELIKRSKRASKKQLKAECDMVCCRDGNVEEFPECSMSNAKKKTKRRQSLELKRPIVNREQMWPIRRDLQRFSIMEVERKSFNETYECGEIINPYIETVTDRSISIVRKVRRPSTKRTSFEARVLMRVPQQPSSSSPAAPSTSSNAAASTSTVPTISTSLSVTESGSYNRKSPSKLRR